jgi:lipopolysaccharide transport system ATP-binding protein
MDEGFGAGDSRFFEKAQERMARFLKSAGTLLLASHSNELLRQFCGRGLVFDSGLLVFSGPLEEALEFYKSNQSSIN